MDNILIFNTDREGLTDELKDRFEKLPYRIVIDNLFVVYGKLGISFQNNQVEQLMLSICSVLIAVLVLVPVNIFIMKYFPWCIGKKKRL